jgi:hypothetical protein
MLNSFILMNIKTYFGKKVREIEDVYERFK